MKKIFLIFSIIPISVIADDLIISDVQNGCSPDFNQYTYFRANFTPNQYTCNTGEYLPADAESCVVCPEYYNCGGGIYTFNEYNDQGNVFKTKINSNIQNGCRADFVKPINNVAQIRAIYEPNIITLNWNDGTNITTTQCTFGETITIPNPPTRPGYKFGGWRVKRRN